MKAKRDALNEVIQNLTVKLYQQAQEAQGNADGAAAGAQGAQDNNSGKGDDGKTVDGDFEEVNNDDKNN
jgi:hypothetical protein